MNRLDALNSVSLKKGVPAFRTGDTVKVHVKVIEGTRSRIQLFQGIVIRKQGAGIAESFTVRKVSFGTGEVAIDESVEVKNDEIIEEVQAEAPVAKEEVVTETPAAEPVAEVVETPAADVPADTDK